MARYIWKISDLSKKDTKKSILSILARNRGLVKKSEIEEFLNPSQDQIFKIDLGEVSKATARIKVAIDKGEKMVVYSDYDADGICATAIVWETLYALGAKILPYVPHRITEGYGLSIGAIDKLASEGVGLIITVDHGVTATSQIKHAKKLGVDVIVTDHHVLPKIKPVPFAMVHSTKLCGAGVAWKFCWELIQKLNPSYSEQLLEKLELAALATIADLVPLTGANRAIVKFGLEHLSKTKRPGLVALIKGSGINGSIGTYEIGHVLAPRINAMGRIEHGIDSLRLLCAKSQKRADELTILLSRTNDRRKDLTISAVDSALKMVSDQDLVGVIVNREWHEGIIGLVASRLVETYGRPMVVISRGEIYSKGSARSIPGFNIVEAIRYSSEFLVDAGGHPMAAGFTIETKHIEKFSKQMNTYAQSRLKESDFEKILNIDCEIFRDEITNETLEIIEKFEPNGIGNPEPVFLTKEMVVDDLRTVGASGSHLKLQLEGIDAIAFGMGDLRVGIRPGFLLDVAYNLARDNFNGGNRIQMKIKDLEVVES